MPMALPARAGAPVVWGGADRCVFVSARVEGVSARFVRFRHPPQVIPNGVDLTLFHPVDEPTRAARSEEHTSELQSQSNLVCRLLLEKKKDYVHHPQLLTHPALLCTLDCRLRPFTLFLY